MLELYHSINSVCAQKVRIALAEKGLEWKSHLMTLQGDQFDPAYIKLNPNAVVPTLVHDGNVIIESNVILHYLDESFPQPPLMPAAPLARGRVRMFLKATDEYVHIACMVLTFATAFRAGMMAMGPQAREASLAKAPDQKRSAYKRDVTEHGLDSAFVVESVRNHDKLLSSIEDAMKLGPYLGGDTYSVADIAVTPYILRLDLLRLSRMWDKRPRVAGWYDRIRKRQSFERAITAMTSKADAAPFTNFEPEPWPKVSQILGAQ